MSSHLQI